MNERIAVLCGLAAVLLWSTVATGFKLGLARLEPAQLLCLGSSISLAFFAMTAVVSGRVREVVALRGRQVIALAGLGLLNPAIYYLILFEAYDRLPAQIAQPLNYTWAITLTLLAVPILGQRITARAALGILLGYAGVIVLLRGGDDAAASYDPLGIALALASTVVWALYWLATVRVAIDPVVLMLVSFAFGTPVIAFVALATTGLPVLTTETLFYGAWVGLIEMGVTFLLWQTAMTRTARAGRIAQFIFLSPFLSLILIDQWLGEPVQARSVLGLSLIVAGLLFSERSKPAA